MVDVVGIHGIAKQQSGRQQLLDDWKPALGDGIERALGAGRHTFSMDIAYYGDLFLAPGREISKGSGGSDAVDKSDRDFFSAIERELVDPDAVLTQPGKGVPVPAVAARLAAWLDEKFGAAGRAMFFGDLAQVRRFQRDPILADQVLHRVQTLLDGSVNVVVAHSLGSIVAYEALCLLPNHGVQTFVTMGSPLALASIRRGLSDSARDRIPELPPGVARWVNVYDPADAVTCAGGLGPIWDRVVDFTVDNGDDRHAVEHYLGKKATGRPVIETLKP